MPELTNRLGTNLLSTVFSTNVPPQVAAFKSLLLSGLQKNNPVFYVIDVLLYVLVFLLMAVVLNRLVKVIARHEADVRFAKAYWGTLVLVLVAAAVWLAPLTDTLRWVAAGLGAVCCTIALGNILWLTRTKAIIALLVTVAAGAGIAKGLTMLADRLLPPDRVRVADQLRVTLGFFDEYAGREGDPVFTSARETMKMMKMGLIMEQEALAAAIALLKNPEILDEMTADHQADLKALDLITDGKPPTPEELEMLGITMETNSNAHAGMELLRDAHAGKTYTEDDALIIASFIRTTRGTNDTSHITDQDVAVLLNAAIRKGEKRRAEKLTEARRIMLAGIPVFGDETNELAHSEFLVTGPFISRALLAERHLEIARANPFRNVSPAERAAWRASESGLYASAVLRFGKEYSVSIRGQILRPGDTITVQSGGRSFLWRLQEITEERARWEPVLGSASSIELTAPSSR